MRFDRDEFSKEKIKEHLKNIGYILVEYLKGSAIDSIIIIAINLIFMLIMKMPYSVLISIVAGVTNFIPNFGPVLGALFGGVILFFDDPKSALWFLIFTVVLQFLDGFFIKPKIFGKSFGMSGFLTLIVMIIGGVLFGVVGMLLSVPVVVIIDYLFKNVILKDKQKDDQQSQ